MATASMTRPKVNLSECHGKIRHPLERLRVYIRAYIAAECVALLLIFLAAWFWIGLLMDFGIFALTRLASRHLWPSVPPFDWMEHVPGVFPVLLVLLIGLALAIVTYHIVRRFIREFRDKTLALLLERRFPKLLGDRLITAVELADINAHTKVGYSRAMIEQTIHDAADRVDQIPLSQVFNWRRLTFLYGSVVFLFLGMAALFVAAFMVCASPSEQHTKIGNGWREARNAGAGWISRNLGLHETYHDRQIYLEVQGYPRYRLTADSIKALKAKDSVPDSVAAKLDILVDRNQLTEAGLEKLAHEDHVPDATLAKLTELKDHDVPQADFEAALKTNLSEEEQKKYGRNIMNRARKTDKSTNEFLDALVAQLSTQEYSRYSKTILSRAEKVDLRVGRDRGTAEVRVRAYKWVIATDDPLRGRYGWRPMKWSDVTPKLLGTKDEIPALPEGLGGEHTPASALAVDDVDNYLGDENLDVAKLVIIRDVMKKADKEERILGGKVSLAGNGHIIEDEDGAVRDLNWQDTQNLSDRLGMEVPSLPKAWGQDLTFDEVKERMQIVDLDQLLAIKNVVFGRLEKMADETGFGRKVRSLTIPKSDGIVIYYNGKDTTKSNKETLTPLANNEYVANLTDLTDDITYTIRGEDYFTPQSRIEIIPEPSLDEFNYERWIPSYVTYRLRNGKLEALKGKRQMLAELGLARTSEESTIEVPNGSKLVLKGKADKELKGPPTITSYQAEHHKLDAAVSLNADDPQSFTVETPQLWIKEFVEEGKTLYQKEYTFDLEIADLDDVRSQFHVKIKLKDDEKPAVNVKPADYLREVKKEPEYTGFEGSRIITVDALFQILGDIKDDHGLASVEFAFTVMPVESKEAPEVTAGLVMRAFGEYFTLDGAPIRELSHVLNLYQIANPRSKGVSAEEYRVPLPLFRQRHPELAVDAEDMEKYLKQPFDKVQRKLLGLAEDASVPNIWEKDELKIEPEDPRVAAPQTGLDLKALQDRLRGKDGKPAFRKAGDREVQTRYRVQVEIEARDTNVETGPAMAQNKESFTLLVVSEAELLSLIAREQEALSSDDLTKVLDDLIEADDRTRDGYADLRRPPANLREVNGIGYRMKAGEDSLDRARGEVQKVREDWERILLEVQANRFNEGQIRDTDNVVTLLRTIVDTDFVEAKEAMSTWVKMLKDEREDALADRITRSSAAAETARAKIAKLMEDVRAVRGMSTKMIDLARVIELARQMESKEAEILDRLHDLQTRLIEDLLRGGAGSGTGSGSGK
jgi:hypothetical protein